MSEQCLFVQSEERQDKERRVSYVFTVCRLDKGLIVGAPIEIWQRETPDGDVPECCPVIATVEYGVRQFSKDGVKQTQPYIRSISEVQLVNIPVPITPSKVY